MASYLSFLAQYRAAYTHRGGIKACALGELSADWFAELQREVAWIVAEQPSSNVADKKHTTNWTRPQGVARQFSLYNATGKSDEYLSDFSPPAKVPKQLTFPQLHAVTRFAKLFGPSLVNLRLNGLGPASGLSLHEESPISLTPFRRTYRVRFHLPVFTSPGAHMLLDGERFHFDERRLYFFHHGCVHAAVNEDDSNRYHFVLDCELTPELYGRLFPGARSRALPDQGDARYDEQAAMALCQGATVPFGEFVTESGTLIEGIDYGRKVPRLADWYRLNYPSLFHPLDRLLGRHTDAH